MSWLAELKSLGEEHMRRSLGSLLGLVLLSLACVQARAADDAVAYVVSYFETAPKAANQARDLLRRLGEASRKDDGSLRFEFLQRIGQPHHFAVLEAWKNKDAQAAHAAAGHTREFRDKLTPLLISPYDERPHSALSVGPMPAPAAEAGVAAIYAVTHVDVIPTQKDVGVALVQQLSETSRKDAGNIRFEALTQISRPNHMTVVEIWKDAQAVDGHAVAAHKKQFREKLSPLSGSLYDERLYKSF